MKNCNLLRVLGTDDLYRDPETGAIINTSSTAREDHVKKVSRQKEARDRMFILEQRVQGVESKIDKIYSKLDCLLNLLAKE